MVPIRTDSRIEIWGIRYINNGERRFDVDKNVKIIQIERGTSEDDYIVEVVDKEVV